MVPPVLRFCPARMQKKAYVHCTAAALRAKDSMMKTATTIQENAEDIFAEAKLINEERAAKEAEKIVDDKAASDDSANEVVTSEVD